MSPGPIGTTPRRSPNSRASGPLPLPGGPRKMSRMGIAHASAKRRETLVIRETGVVSHDQVAVNLLDQVQRHADDDEQSGAPVESGNPIVHVHRAGDQVRDD